MSENEEPDVLEDKKDDIILLQATEVSKISYGEGTDFKLYTVQCSQNAATKNEDLQPYSTMIIKKIKEKFPSSGRKSKANLRIKQGFRLNENTLTIYLRCVDDLPVTAVLPRKEFHAGNQWQLKISCDCIKCFPSK